MLETRPYLYVKAGCPWCEEAEAYLQDHNIAYDKVDVRADASALDELQKLSGQTKAPTMKWNDEILADFGAAELDVFLKARGVVK